jgi:uncharacterized OB-fold protein
MFTKTSDSPVESIITIKEGKETVHTICSKCGKVYDKTLSNCPQCNNPTEE